MALVFKGEDVDERMVFQGKEGAWDLRGTSYRENFPWKLQGTEKGGGLSAIELLLMRLNNCMGGRKRQGRCPDVVLVLVFVEEERSQIELNSSLVLGCALFEGARAFTAVV